MSDMIPLEEGILKADSNRNPISEEKKEEPNPAPPMSSAASEIWMENPYG